MKYLYVYAIFSTGCFVNVAPDTDKSSVEPTTDYHQQSDMDAGTQILSNTQAVGVCSQSDFDNQELFCIVNSAIAIVQCEAKNTADFCNAALNPADNKTKLASLYSCRDRCVPEDQQPESCLRECVSFLKQEEISCVDYTGNSEEYCHSIWGIMSTWGVEYLVICAQDVCLQ